MPIPEMKKFNLIELLKQSFDLHKNEPGAKINFQTDYDQIYAALNYVGQGWIPPTDPDFSPNIADGLDARFLFRS